MGAKIRLLWDRLLIIPEANELSSTLIIPDIVKREYECGVVAFAGPGKRKRVQRGDKLVTTDEIIPMEIKVGDKVFYGKHHGQPQRIKGVNYVAINQGDVAAVIDE